MKWIFKHRYLTGFTFIAVAACLFRLSPEISALWTDAVIHPFALSLHSFTGSTPFPVLEIICILIAGILAAGFVRALCACILRKTPAPFRQWLKIPACIALTVSAMYVLMWYPAYWTDSGVSAVYPDIEQIKWLCTEMIADLNTVDLEFSTPQAILESAPAVSGLPSARVKAARYPEWMRALHIAGLYVPWTGEAIVNTTAYPATLPFTAVHELMHLSGVADEGSANIAAWEACRAAGGEFYTSARLWVLKYAMEMLADAESESVGALYSRMNPTLYAVFSRMNGKAYPAASGAGMLLAALGLSRTTSSYPDVVRHVLNLP